MPISLKDSSIANKVPKTTDLNESGEVAINSYDGILYYKVNATNYTTLDWANYLGTIAIVNTTTTSPTLPTTGLKDGSFFKVTGAGGLFNGVVYTSGDWLYYNGSAWGKFNKVPNRGVNGQINPLRYLRKDAGNYVIPLGSLQPSLGGTSTNTDAFVYDDGLNILNLYIDKDYDDPLTIPTYAFTPTGMKYQGKKIYDETNSKASSYKKSVRLVSTEALSGVYYSPDGSYIRARDQGSDATYAVAQGSNAYSDPNNKCYLSKKAFIALYNNSSNDYRSFSSQTTSQKLRGNWDATTAFPTTSGLTLGDYYFVSKAGTTVVNGVSSWAVGDIAIYGGSTTGWVKVEATKMVHPVGVMIPYGVSGYPASYDAAVRSGIVRLSSSEVTAKGDILRITNAGDASLIPGGQIGDYAICSTYSTTKSFTKLTQIEVKVYWFTFVVRFKNAQGEFSGYARVTSLNDTEAVLDSYFDIAASNYTVTGWGWGNAPAGLNTSFQTNGVYTGISYFNNCPSLIDYNAGNFGYPQIEDIDGYALQAGDRVLLQSERSDYAANYVYVLETRSKDDTGGNGIYKTPWKLVRESDFLDWSSMVGAKVYVEEGNLFGGTEWVCTALKGDNTGEKFGSSSSSSKLKWIPCRQENENTDLVVAATSSFLKGVRYMNNRIVRRYQLAANVAFTSDKITYDSATGKFKAEDTVGSNTYSFSNTSTAYSLREDATVRMLKDVYNVLVNGYFYDVVVTVPANCKVLSVTATSGENGAISLVAPFYFEFKPSLSNPSGSTVPTLTTFPFTSMTVSLLYENPLSTIPTIDTTYVPKVGDRLLIKDELGAINDNGIYLVESTGDSSNRWSLIRDPNYYKWNQVAGARIRVGKNGATNFYKNFFCTSDFSSTDVFNTSSGDKKNRIYFEEAGSTHFREEVSTIVGGGAITGSFTYTVFNRVDDYSITFIDTDTTAYYTYNVVSISNTNITYKIFKNGTAITAAPSTLTIKISVKGV